ncbi:aspartyl-phosphate phosphatase Spo0E family protein [Scopulibacillus cellulosilyticus]|uniref:Aspartyl-phosphate phosphatase Spo0E family protein n=1 Tax=Scopulibacillus cellulosilyticus TaxID=2665665 RepID=A0ABW2Q0N8_9BACL
MKESKNPTRIELMQMINRKRKEMMKIASIRGLKNKETVKQSKELDVLINLYQRNLLQSKSS